MCKTISPEGAQIYIECSPKLLGIVNWKIEKHTQNDGSMTNVQVHKTSRSQLMFIYFHWWDKD